MSGTQKRVAAPKISILMATWNCSPLLAAFFRSLEEQSQGDWELLILDNCSSDGLPQLVRQYEAAHPDQLIRFSSQIDSGIYDAWNRGVALAQGTYLCFIGADDAFVSSQSLQQLLDLSVSSAELITCRNSYYSSDGRFLRDWGSSWDWRRMRESMNIAHPGMLVRRDLFQRFGLFDPSFKICGDYEWFLRLSPAVHSAHCEASILKIVQAGVSHTKISAVYAETFRAQKRHLNLLWSAWCWLVNWLKYGRRLLVGLT
ncbi:MAG: glycosyltransferase [Sphingomonadales bacterium]|nr:glycosyltransferase [Sphingomonadales bacterium]